MGDDGNYRHWDPNEVLRRTAKHYRERAEDVEGPARLGECRVWRVWTFGDGAYQAHYAVAHRDEDLKYLRNFADFANWLHDAFTRRDEIVYEEARHRRRLELIRIAIASIVILALLALVVLQVGVRNAEGLNVSHIVSVLLGGGVAYLLGPWVMKDRSPPPP